MSDEDYRDSRFVQLMNDTAQSLGCKDTHFTNANGLHDPDHYTTAYDMALITKEALTSKTFREYMSSQNHGYAVDGTTIDPAIAKEAFINVNDGTNEGLAYEGKNIFTVQFHPEACPGPQDSGYLFDRFMDMMKGAK